MSLLKELMLKHLSDPKELTAFLESKVTCSYRDIVFAQDDNGCVYLYSRSGKPIYEDWNNSWTPDTGNSTRSIEDSDGNTLSLPIAIDQTTYLGDVAELLASVSQANAAPLFSVDLVDAPQVILAPALVLGVEAKRDRILDIDKILVDLQAESAKLLAEIEGAGFLLKVKYPVPKAFDVGCLVEMVRNDHSYTNMQIGQRCRVIDESDDYVTTVEGFYVNKRDLIVI